MNVASVSWGDHLSFGEGDGRLDTPDALARRMEAWRAGLSAGALHWRALRTRIPATTLYVAARIEMDAWDLDMVLASSQKAFALPPGIAKNFDSRVSSQLPHYEGYEWKQIGTRIVEGHAAASFNGRVSVDYRPEGLVWTLQAPLDSFVNDPKQAAEAG